MMEMRQENNISAREFIDTLLSEGSRTTCDSSNETARKQGDCLPPYFNPILFKRGQDLYKKYIYSMDLMHAFGVFILYSIPTALNVARSRSKPSFRLYDVHAKQLRTNINLQSFYYSDFASSSSDWKALEKIKMKHNAASKRSSKKGLNPLTQLDMAVAQFAFVGLSIIRSEFVGLRDVSEEEWRCFHHYWRVIGYLVGIEERFNICSPSLDRTKQIAELLIEELIKPEMDKKCPVYLNIIRVSSLSFKPMLPEIEMKCAVNYIYNLLEVKSVAKMYEANYVDMNWFLTVYYKCFAFSLIYMLKWTVYRAIRNSIHIVNMYLITKFPLIPRLECTIFNYLYL